MQITVKAHNVEITQALNDFVNEKFSKKLENMSEGVKSIAVTLSVEKLEHKAEAVIEVIGDTFHTEAVVNEKESDMYAAIDLLLDKVVRLVVKHKEKLQK